MAKLHYSYTRYNGCPEATEISESRNHTQVLLVFVCFLICLPSLVIFLLALFQLKIDAMLKGLGGLAVGGLGLFYLFFHYNKVTEKQIKEAIERRNKRWEEALQSHDTQTLVELKPKEKSSSYVTFKELLESHKKWLSGDQNRKQLVMFAEDMSDNSIYFKGEIINNAVFSHCLFYKMDLRGTQFRDCDLSYSCFIRCKTAETDFTGSKMEGVRFK